MASTKTFINLANKYDRVVVIVDMDCFYCQVEEKFDPSLSGKPMAVVQYNAWKGGGIIAVNYLARAEGVTRHMRGDEAKERCPNIVLVKVPSVREKADLTKYREAGREVAAVLQKFTPLLERASVDEAYLDITEEVVKRLETMNKGSFQLTPTELTNTYAVGYDNFGQYIQEISSRIEQDMDDYDCEEDDIQAWRKSDIKLLLGSAIVNEIRAKVKEKTGYDCSAGIAHNKILAKLACGMNKPNKQTILPLRQISPLFSTLPVGKIKGLGGKFGEDICELLQVKFLGDLNKFSESELQKRFDEKNGSWLYLVARGIDLELVTPRYYSKSIGCCKKFPGRNAITGLPTLHHWLNELANEICDRMEKDVIENNRKAKQMVVSYIQEINGDDVSSSRSSPLDIYDPESMAKQAFEVLKKNTDQLTKTGTDGALNNPLKFLGISVGKFETIDTNKNTIQRLFLNHTKKNHDGNSVAEEMPKISPSDSAKPDSKANSLVTYFNKTGPKETAKVNTQPEPNSSSSTDNPEISETKEIKSFFLNALKRQKADEMAKDIEKKPVQQSVTIKENIKSSCDKPSNNLTTPAIASTSNYTETYAEFLVPQTKADDFKDCEKCGKKILTFDYETHADFHFALELSQDQRVQFRTEIKSKPSPPPKKKPKISTGNRSNTTQKLSKTSNEISIEKFLAKRNPDVNDSHEEKVKCFECGAMIVIGKLAEHMNYHAARKLQVELNRNEMITNSATINKNKASKSLKLPAVKTKSIETFFSSQK